MTNADKLNQSGILLEDSIIRLNAYVDTKLSYGGEITNFLDLLYVMRSLSYASKCGNLVYKDEQYNEIFELIDRVLIRCSSSSILATSGYVPISTPSIFHQYVLYDNNQELYSTGAGVKKTFDDGITQVRKRVEGYDLYIDVTLTPIGFSGVENLDWETRVIHVGQNTTWRSGVRLGVFYDDCTITATGFAGTKDIDWEVIHSAAGAGTETKFREGVRAGNYVIDKALTPIGFSGVEDRDWVNLETHK